ncbi:unnamed protein product [Chrysoparadoxa australica]
MRAFVTVGTTSFDKLISAACDPSCLAELRGLGYDKVIVQWGRGSYEPSGVGVEGYRFKPNLKEDMAQADLIISHAGAGSIMEALQLGKKTIVVVNDALMHNHQEEVADALVARNYLVAVPPHRLREAITQTDWSRMRAYPSHSTEVFALVVGQTMAG